MLSAYAEIRMYLLSTVTVVPLDKHDLLSNLHTLSDRAETEDIADSWVRLLVSVCDTHASPGGDVETGKVTVLVNDGDEANVISEYVDIVCWGDRDCNFELYGLLTEIKNGKGDETNLARKVELPVERLNVLQCISSNEFLVQPDLVVCRGTRQKILRDPFREVEGLTVQLR